ncbi:stage II sporulation protein M [Eubacterium sp.]|uniref:stage II sporulation protein M n=1 Tax=Eubacterium sp. TaxID=142586 RepID=UPI003F04ACF4
MSELNLPINNRKIEVFTQDNVRFLYQLFFYIAGMVLGVWLFRALNLSKYSSTIEDFILIKNDSLINIIIDRLSIYVLVYVVTILLGLCLIGFPVINVIPLVCGVELSLKLSFIYSLYSVKGIGYSVLMIIPEATAFLVLLFYTIKDSKDLSSSLFNISKNNLESEIDLKQYLKKFMLYCIGIICISILNSIMMYLFNSIIKI